MNIFNTTKTTGSFKLVFGERQVHRVCSCPNKFKDRPAIWTCKSALHLNQYAHILIEELSTHAELTPDLVCEIFMEQRGNCYMCHERMFVDAKCAKCTPPPNVKTVNLLRKDTRQTFTRFNTALACGYCAGSSHLLPDPEPKSHDPDARVYWCQECLNYCYSTLHEKDNVGFVCSSCALQPSECTESEHETIAWDWYTPYPTIAMANHADPGCVSPTSTSQAC